MSTCRSCWLCTSLGPTTHPPGYGSPLISQLSSRSFPFLLLSLCVRVCVRVFWSNCCMVASKKKKKKMCALTPFQLSIIVSVPQLRAILHKCIVESQAAWVYIMWSREEEEEKKLLTQFPWSYKVGKWDEALAGWLSRKPLMTVYWTNKVDQLLWRQEIGLVSFFFQ